MYVHYVPATGKRYVGVTGQKPERRFQNGCGYVKNKRFYADILKYGWASVETTVIAETDDFELATCFENAAMQRYDTLNEKHGYNDWSSGKENRPKASIGRKISKAKMGHSVSEETRQKLREHNGVPVAQMDMDGNFIRTFDSMAEAAKAVGAFKSNIWAVCQGRKRSCRGFRWMTLDRFNDAKRAEEADRVKHEVK